MINRYEETNATVLNRALGELEERYQSTGNAMEMISEGTLTANTTQVSLSLGGIGWRWLRLRAVMQISKNVWAGLRANQDPSNSYHSVVVQDLGVFVQEKNKSAVLGLLGDAGQVGSIDVSFMLNSVGFMMHGYGAAFVGSGFVLDVPTQEWNPASSDLAYHPYAGFYRGGPVSSLQLVIPSEQPRSPLPVTPAFVAGGTYRLEGIRA